MRIKKLWMAPLIGVILGIGLFYRANIAGLAQGQSSTMGANLPGGGTTAIAATTSATTTIRVATTGVDQVSASGNIELGSQRSVMLEVTGVISQITVEEGDTVARGDLLLTLDAKDLRRAEKQSELDFASAQAKLDQLLEPASEAEVAAARANLASAQEKLADVNAGPSEAEMKAAEATLAAAQAKYQELKAGPSDAELTQIRADLEKTTVALKQAQWAYDQVSYKGDVGASSQAADLQDATIDYEAAKASYEISVEPATQSDLQTQLGTIQSAQKTLDDLRAQPTRADVADAEASVASAQSALDDLLNGPSEAERRADEISVEQAALSLEEAKENLARTQVYAPLSGMVLSVNVEVGDRVGTSDTSAGSAITLGDLSTLELTVSVAEVDITKVHVGQVVQVAVDALPDVEIKGVVKRIAPSSTSSSGVVNYPVNVELVDAATTGVRPGMTAVATILVGEGTAADKWLVPTTAVQKSGEEATVMILRNGQPTPISVTVLGTEGEWTVVQSADLHAGDEALGGVSSYLGTDTNTNSGPPGGMPMGPPPGN